MEFISFLFLTTECNLLNKLLSILSYVVFLFYQQNCYFLAAHSVHFEKDGSAIMSGSDTGFVTEDELNTRMADIDSDTWQEVNEQQKRNLDQWCFAEHMEPYISRQVRFYSV